MKRLPLGAVFLLLASGTVRADEIVTVDNTRIAFNRLTVEPAEPAPRAVVTAVSGQTSTLSCDTVAEIAFKPVEEKKNYTDKELWLNFTSGDKWLGILQEKAVEGGFQVQTAGGSMEVKLEALSSLIFPGNQKAMPADLPVPKDGDIMITATGDRIEGTVEEITREHVVFDASLLKTRVTKKLGDVAGIFFRPLGKPPTEPDRLMAIVMLTDGSSVRGLLQSVKDGQLKLTTLFKREAVIPVPSLSAIYFKNGRVVYLSDLEAAKAEEQPNYIRMEKPHPSDLSFPHQKDQSVRRTKLSIKGVQYRKGLGVHSRSALTYRIDGKFASLAATVGLDDLARACPNNLGSVVFEIVADGKKIFDSGLVRAADAPREVSVSLQGVRELVLIVDYGEDGSVCDYADWAGARLIR